MGASNLRTLLSNEHFESEDFEKLSGLSSEVIDEIVVLEKNTQVMLVKMDLEEEVLSETILKLAVNNPPTTTTPNDEEFFESGGWGDGIREYRNLGKNFRNSRSKKQY